MTIKKPITRHHAPLQMRRHIVILAVPPANELDVVGPFQVFAIANRHFTENNNPYEVEVTTTATERNIAGHSGLSIVSHSFYRDIRDGVDTLLVAGGLGARSGGKPSVLEWINYMSQKTRRLGSVCTGAFLLAEAGLLDNKKATTHWAFAQEFASRFPRVSLDIDPIWLRDGKTYTSAGVTAGMDLALALVEEDLGSKIALAVARDLVLFLKRPGGQAQFSRSLAAQSSTRKSMQELLVWIVENLEKDLTVEKLASRAAMSRRNFTRVFADELGTSPAQYVEQLRVEAARRLFEETEQGVEEIAAACGFSSAEIMRRAFLRSIGAAPSQYRERFHSAGNSPVQSRIHVESFQPKLGAVA
jgi:transcriptional regulator GlxA family with amidase domain